MGSKLYSMVIPANKMIMLRYRMKIKVKFIDEKELTWFRSMKLFSIIFQRIIYKELQRCPASIKLEVNMNKNAVICLAIVFCPRQQHAEAIKTHRMKLHRLTATTSTPEEEQVKNDLFTVEEK